MAIRFSALLLLTATAALAQAPPGFKTFENRLAPLTFHYPVAYKEVPLPPTDQLLVAKFVLQKTPRELKKVDKGLLKRANLQLRVFLFEDGDASVTEGGAGGEERGPSTVREAMEERSRVTSWQQFEARLGWKLRKEGDDRFLLYGQRLSMSMSVQGWLVRKREGNKVFGVYGYTAEPHLDALKKIVERVAKSTRIAEQNANSDLASARIARMYGNGKFAAAEWRIKVRQQLAKGWKAVDTDNYLIVHHSKNVGLIKNIARDIEAMRLFYMELFPPTTAMDRVSVVRICQTREEYHQYGGPPNTGGYWHPGNEELVLFDYSYTQKRLSAAQKKAMAGRKLTTADSMLVLRHEAFHQYIYYAVGELAPHDWFNEGYGDYFSGAVVSPNTGRVRRIDPASWRLHLAKDMCEFGEGFLPLEKILKAERAQFYNRSRIAQYYAGAWSFVYFLKHSKQALAHPQWSKLLDDYFVNVKTFYDDELAGLDDVPDLRQKRVAGREARKRALKSTLQGVDVAELEKVWRQWVVDIRDPWPQKRRQRRKQLEQQKQKKRKQER